MKAVSSLVWVLLIGGLLLGFGLRVFLKLRFGPSGGPEQGLEAFQGVRQLDRQAHNRLEQLGIEFRETTQRQEPSVDLRNPTEKDFQFLEEVLRSSDPKARVAAAKVLRDIGSPRGVEPLIGAIRGIDDQDRFFLGCSLAILNTAPPERRRALLIPAWELHREDLADEFKEALRLKLRDIGALDPAWEREAAATDPDPLVRRFALEELSSHSSAPRGVLGVGLADPDAQVRALAAAALAKH